MFPDSTPSDGMQLEGRSVFAGRFCDLPESEQRVAGWRGADTDLAAASTAHEPGPLMNIFYSAISHLRHGADADTHGSMDVVRRGRSGQDKTLYLVRSKHVSAAQALDRNNATFDFNGRSLQIALLKEFRDDTREAATGEVNRWVAEQLPERPVLRDSGAISAGLVVPMTPEEAKRLALEVPDLVFMRNRALALISPATSSNAVPTMPQAAAWHLEAIGMSTARRNGSAYSGRGVNIALLDTGIQLDHGEIANKVMESWKIRSNPTTSDFSALEPDPYHFDTDGHGTHVAGLICGTNVGAAPDARLVSLLLMPRKLATTFDFIRCLDWVAEHPEISLVNCSAGITPFTAEMMPFVADLINTGALLIAAVGNDGPNNTRSPGNYVDGLSVGSVDAPGSRVSSFSGSGQQTLNNSVYTVPDLVAPGGDVWSSYPGDQFVARSGTSMAAPIVTGIAACLIEQAGGLLSPLDLIDSLVRGCRKLAGEPDIRQGAGLVQVPSRP